MKTFSALVCLLLVSTVGCGQQDKSPATSAQPASSSGEAPAAKSTVTTPSSPSPSVGAGQSEGSGETIEEETPAQIDKETTQDAVNIRLASAIAEGGKPAKPAADSRWKEGVNYKRLIPAQPTDVPPDKVEVVEVFWYGCGHCYALEPYIATWNEKKASYIQFIRVPVVWGPGHLAHARLFYTLHALGREDLHSAVFRETQVAGSPLASNDEAETEKLQTAFAKRHGIKEEDFRKAYRSFEVNTKVQRAQDLTRRYRVEGVPTIVINGKYTADVGSAGNQSQLMELINDLAAREHKKE